MAHVKYLISIFTADCLCHPIQMAGVETIWKLHVLIVMNSWRGCIRNSEQKKKRWLRPTYYVYIVVGSWISYTARVERIVGWVTHKTLPFCFSPILITSCLHRKDTRLSTRVQFAFWESLGTRLIWYTDKLALFPVLPSSLLFGLHNTNRKLKNEK